MVEKLEEFRAASISVQKDFENIDNELLEIENETKILDNTLINVGEDFGKVGQDI